MTASLLAISDEKMFFGVDKSKCGLEPVQCDVWDGWIFINLNPDNKVGLHDYLGEMGVFLSDIPYPNPGPLDQDPGSPQVQLEVPCRCLQRVVSHPGAALENHGPSFSGVSDPASHLQNAEFSAPIIPSRCSATPLRADGSAAGGTPRLQGHGVRERVLAANQSDETEALRAHRSVNPGKSETWSMDINEIFPNFHLDVAGGGFWTHEIWPITPDYSRYEMRFLVPEPRPCARPSTRSIHRPSCRSVVLEDLANVERTHKGVASRAKNFMILQGQRGADPPHDGHAGQARRRFTGKGPGGVRMMNRATVPAGERALPAGFGVFEEFVACRAIAGPTSTTSTATPPSTRSNVSTTPCIPAPTSPSVPTWTSFPCAKCRPRSQADAHGAVPGPPHGGGDTGRGPGSQRPWPDTVKILTTETL